MLLSDTLAVHTDLPPAMDTETGALVSTAHTGLPFVWILFLQRAVRPSLLRSAQEHGVVLMLKKVKDNRTTSENTEVCVFKVTHSMY